MRALAIDDDEGGGGLDALGGLDELVVVGNHFEPCDTLLFVSAVLDEPFGFSADAFSTIPAALGSEGLSLGSR